MHANAQTSAEHHNWRSVLQFIRKIIDCFIYLSTYKAIIFFCFRIVAKLSCSDSDTKNLRYSDIILINLSITVKYVQFYL